MSTPKGFRAGFVAVVGRPNVGKSSLINAIVGSKVSIVTPKPQTTRHRIQAVLTTAEAQLVFVDTPGLHRKAARAMNRLMNRTALSALSGADVAVFVCDATRWTEEDQDVVSRLGEAGIPAIAAVNKIDLVQPRTLLLETIDRLRSRHPFREIVPVSARRRENLEALTRAITGYLPESPPLFPEDMQTDRSAEFHAAETIREKLTMQLHKEVPYGLTVQVARYEQDARGIDIDATIFVERVSQKGIVVGSGGRVLKAVGQSARKELARKTGRPVHLTLWVKVRENWADSEEDLKRLGYEAGADR